MKSNRINCEDYGAYSPAKYPSFKPKRKPKKKIAEEPKKKARKTLKLDIPKRGKLQSTLDCWLKEKSLKCKHWKKDKRFNEQTHPSYQKTDPCLFRCQCDKPLILATSHSVKNPNRIYLKCPRGVCKFFQWIDEPPKGLAEAILINGENPTKTEGT